jgi:hypothetical protein
MEDIIIYVVVFGLIIMFTWIYYGNKDKIKLFSLGRKNYSFGYIDILIEKHGSIIKFIKIKIYIKDGNKQNNETIYMELILNKNNRKMIIIEPSVIHFTELNINILDNSKEYLLEFNNFKDFMEKNNFQKDSFRFVYQFNETKKMKTVILSINKRWSLYVPDTGNYN